MLMLLTLLVLVLALFALLALGVVALARGATTQSEQQKRVAKEALEKLQQLAGSVAMEMGEHSLEVEQIASALQTEPENGEVLSAVARLMQVNQRMQEQLVSAKEKLHTQARQIESHAFEARTDALTQVANRRALDDAIARRIEEQQRCGATCCVLLLDVDHFKKFNDSYGHQAGDEVLRQVARALRQHANDDDLVARYGGEEFAIVFTAIMPSSRAAAERARAAIGAAKVRFEGRDLRVTASAGIAELQPGEDQATLLKRVDAALYASKKGGRNCLHWNDGYKNHLWKLDQKTAAKTSGQDDLSALIGMDWATDADKLPEAVSSAAAVLVSSKSVFVDDMIRRLAQVKRDRTPLCLILVQLDGFAQGIQKHGDEAASLVLRIAAQILNANLRDMDHVSRLGSDTFALLLPAAGLEDGTRCAERIRLAAEQCHLPDSVQGFLLRLTIGVVETDTGDDMQLFLQRGRNALQVAIDRGQGIYAQDVSGTLAKTHLAAHG